MLLALLLAASCVLPERLRDDLARVYPAAHVLTLQDLGGDERRQFSQDHGARCPGIVAVDFYGDKKPTLAIVLIDGPRATLVMAHRRRARWELATISETDGRPVVWSEEPAEYTDVYGRERLRVEHPAVVLCGYGSWAILFAWSKIGVRSIWISD